MSGNQRFPLEEAFALAKQYESMLAPYCERICIAGSVRRMKAEVGDIEILFIPRIIETKDPNDLFGTKRTNLVTEAIDGLMAAGSLAIRQKSNGQQGAFGEQIKTLVDTKSGIPVDLFSTREESWWNYLVCRTGPAELNQKIASRALKKGWRWNPFSAGFHHKLTGDIELMKSEESVFEFVGLDYLPPEKR